MNQGGDDLEDDFVIDDIVALSGEEDGGMDGGFFSDAAGDNEQNDVMTSPEDDNGVGPQTSDTIDQSAAVLKKRKRREKEKERKAKKRKLAESMEAIESSVTDQPSSHLSDYLASVQIKSFPKMSTLELDDIRMPEAAIADTTTWTGPRNLENLVEFITKVLPTLHTRLSQKSKTNGAPTLLFVTGAALRVADVTRVLKDKRLRGEKGGEVAKLFAKHFKLAEHVAYLRRTKVGAAVGTPGRLGKLLCDTDALTVSALSHIMLDVTYRDSKKRSLLDIPETRDQVFKTVFGGTAIQKAIKDGKIQVVLF